MSIIAADLVDATLVASTCVYAHWLAENKDLEPDHTWLEVSVGVAMCLSAAGAHGRLAPADWRAYERAVWRAFLLGGAPIIVGEVAQWLRRRQERRRYLLQRQ